MDISVVKYEKRNHLKMMHDFLYSRKMNENETKLLPIIGFIGFYGDEPVGAIFIRICEGKFALMDSLITHASFNPEVRNGVIEALVKKSIEYGKECGLKRLIGFSIDANTIKRAIKHNFKLLDHKVFSLELGV